MFAAAVAVHVSLDLANEAMSHFCDVWQSCDFGDWDTGSLDNAGLESSASGPDAAVVSVWEVGIATCGTVEDEEVGVGLSSGEC